MQKKWVMRENLAAQFEGDFDAPDFIKNILFHRGVKTKEEAKKFFEPDYEKDLDDPLLILNMKKAAERIIRAIKNKEKIVVWGDYDADGICAAAILHHFLKKTNCENFEIYIPDRNRENHGLNEKIIEEFSKKEVKLIITVDCGVSDYEETKKAKEMGIDVIITDHHIPPEKLPPANAIVNLYQKEEKYPFKDFSGAGVAFKLVSAILKQESFGLAKGWEKWLLDLTAIATISDMVSLLDENRTLVYYGLKVLAKTPRLGLKLLLRKLNLGERITAEDVAFLIAPRINAASRMDHAETGFYLLTTELYEEAEWLANRLEEMNIERKKMIEDALKEIKVEQNQALLPKILVVGKEKWPVAIAGLIATKIVEEYDRPACVWGKLSETEIKVSCRNNGSIDLVELFNNVRGDIFNDFGGHPMAAGFNAQKDKIEILEASLNDALEKISKKEKGAAENILLIDAELSLDEVNWDIYALLEKFEPFGMGNPKPVFLFSALKIEKVKTFGNGGLHLELSFKKSNGEAIRAIGFFMSQQSIRPSEGRIESGNTINLCASLDKNYYNGYNELRLKIVDLKLI